MGERKGRGEEGGGEEGEMEERWRGGGMKERGRRREGQKMGGGGEREGEVQGRRRKSRLIHIAYQSHTIIVTRGPIMLWLLS